MDRVRRVRFYISKYAIHPSLNAVEPSDQGSDSVRKTKSDAMAKVSFSHADIRQNLDEACKSSYSNDFHVTFRNETSAKLSVPVS